MAPKIQGSEIPTKEKTTYYTHVQWTWYTISQFYFVLFFWPCCVACGILVPWPGIEPVPPALEAEGLNHWTAREVLNYILKAPYSGMVEGKNQPCGDGIQLSHYHRLMIPEE